MVSLSRFSLIFCCAGIVAVVLITGCTTPIPGFSGIYVSSENPQQYLEFRTDGSVFAPGDEKPEEIGRWTKTAEDQLRVCKKDVCYDLGIGKNTVYYYQNGKRQSLNRVDKIPETKSTTARVQPVQTPTYKISSNVVMIGNVYGYALSTRAGSLEYILFTLGGVNGGDPVDVSKITVAYSDDTTKWPALAFVPGTSINGNSIAHAARWGLSEIQSPGNQKGNTVLSKDVPLTVVMGVPETTTPNMAFQVILTMPDGSEIRLSKTVPPSIAQTNVIY